MCPNICSRVKELFRQRILAVMRHERRCRCTAGFVSIIMERG